MRGSDLFSIGPNISVTYEIPVIHVAMPEDVWVRTRILISSALGLLSHIGPSHLILNAMEVGLIERLDTHRLALKLLGQGHWDRDR